MNFLTSCMILHSYFMLYLIVLQQKTINELYVIYVIVVLKNLNV